MNNNLPELLAPAGSPDSLRAALAAGADAVYFGGTSFSNRMRAKNFTDGDLCDAIRLCHDAGAKAHITVNTRVRDREMDDVLALCELLLGSASPDERADAIICADFGVAREILTRYPHAVLHASTQTSLSAPSDCRELAKLGFTRLVVPRELSKAEIAALCADGKEHGFEIEMFLHGAHCVSLSGQCLMSFVMGGRSGNRGECAQPCRLPFRIESDGAEKTDTPLSLADMCLAGRIPEVIGTGVASLKLEGRLKPANYVYGVTAIYRRLLDERRSADKQELRALEELFTRGFTDGYFAGRYASMGGKTASETEKKGTDRTAEINRKLKERLAAQDKQAKLAEERTLTASFVMREGQPLSLTLVCGSVSASVEGDMPQQAEGRPMDSVSAAKNLVKFGGTGFVLPVEKITFDMGENLWVPVSALNSLRRAALAALQEELSKPVQPGIPEKSPDISADITENNENPSASAPVSKENVPVRRVSDKPYGRQYRVAELADTSLLDGFTEEEAAEFLGYFRRVYVPYDKAAEAVKLAARVGADCKIGGVLPPLTPDDEKVRGILAGLMGSGASRVSRVLCHTPGQLALALEAGLPGDLSFRANITSSFTLALWRSTGLFASVQLSPELPAGAVNAIGDHAVPGALRRPAGALVYGKIPVMALSRCVLCGGKCRKGNFGGRNSAAAGHDCRAQLIDRKGEVFPVFGLPDCESMICNSVPIWMGDRLPDLKSLSFLSFFFTDETPSAALRVLRAYRDGLPGTGRRL